MNRNILILSVLLLGLQLMLSSNLDNVEDPGLPENVPEGYLGQYQPKQDKVDIVVLPSGDDTKRSNFLQNNGIMRSLRSPSLHTTGIMRSTRTSPTDFLRNAGIMRSTRSVPLDYLRNTGIMRSTRSTPDYLRNAGIMRATRSTPDYLRNTAIMRSTRSASGNIEHERLRDTGVLRSLRSQQPDFLHNTGILRSTRSNKLDNYPFQDFQNVRPNLQETGFYDNLTLRYL